MDEKSSIFFWPDAPGAGLGTAVKPRNGCWLGPLPLVTRKICASDACLKKSVLSKVAK